MAISGNCVLPEGVAIEILLRLPVKLLLRFKCVCKFWYSLIQNPHFISNHLMHNQIAKPNFLVHHYIPETNKCRLSMFPDETLPPPQEHVDYIEVPAKILNGMLGPVNGLFLLHGHFQHKLMDLWNADTREARVLPLPTTILPPDISCITHALGFGLDPLTNNYKVVWFPYTQIDFHNDPMVALYTLGNDSWRYVDDIDLNCIANIITTSPLFPICQSIFLNEAYYWLAKPNRIVVFDVISDVFKAIQGLHDTKSNFEELVVHNNSVAMLCYKHSCRKFVDMWVTSEEGCWTKHFSVGPILDVT